MITPEYILISQYNKVLFHMTMNESSLIWIYVICCYILYQDVQINGCVIMRKQLCYIKITKSLSEENGSEIKKIYIFSASVLSEMWLNFMIYLKLLLHPCSWFYSGPVAHCRATLRNLRYSPVFPSFTHLKQTDWPDVLTGVFCTVFCQTFLSSVSLGLYSTFPSLGGAKVQL